MGIPLYAICCFSLLPLIFLLWIWFLLVWLICLVFLLGFILYGTLCTSWTWVVISFPMLEKFLTIISSNIFWDPFFFSSSFGAPIIRMLVHLMFPRCLWDCPHFFSFFFLYSAPWQLFPPFYLPGQLFLLLPQVILLLISFSVFFISVIVLFITVCLFFSSSRSLLNSSYIFSIFASILFPRSWIIFTIIILNSFFWKVPYLHFI